jgi:hypothetical protein
MNTVIGSFDSVDFRPFADPLGFRGISGDLEFVLQS